MKKTFFLLTLSAFALFFSTCDEKSVVLVNKPQTNADAIEKIKLIDEVEIPMISKNFNAKEFSKSDRGKAIIEILRDLNLRDWEEWLSNNAERITKNPGFSLNIYQVTKNTRNFEILDQVRENPFSEIEYFMSLNHLVVKKAKGETGKTSAGGLNLFHVLEHDLTFPDIIYTTTSAWYSVLNGGWPLQVGCNSDNGLKTDDNIFSKK